MNHGGKRKGAGRKPREVPLVAHTLKAEPDVSERFKALCEAYGISQNKLFAEMVRKKRFPR